MSLQPGTTLGPYERGSAEDFVLMSLAAGTRLGPYEIQTPLGAGEAGRVSGIGDLLLRAAR